MMHGIIKQEKHHLWVQTARLYLHLICIISNKYQNSGIFSQTKRKPEKVAKHTQAHLKDVLLDINLDMIFCLNNFPTPNIFQVETLQKTWKK